MVCSKCGAEIKETAEFCPACGTKVSQTVETSPSYTAYSEAAVEQCAPAPKATAALVLGIIGLIAWLFPIAGFPITIVGLVMSVRGMGQKRPLAKAGLILNIIGLVICIINSAIGAYMGATGGLRL